MHLIWKEKSARISKQHIVIVARMSQKLLSVRNKRKALKRNLT